MRIRLDDSNYMAIQQRLHSAIYATAENKFEALVKRYLEFLQRFPQHIIASYLGITKETLSRIQKQSSKR
jgi:CRP-like cAMP-binding protein